MRGVAGSAQTRYRVESGYTVYSGLEGGPSSPRGSGLVPWANAAGYHAAYPLGAMGAMPYPVYYTIWQRVRQTA